ncbi:hypothetical protein H4R18_003437 [Coemansia javaensis]|uniref:DUF7492 domain-containing protein n=1 Tax=Coemansia javaensis TaxID=2761396 RepID=A0A9W8LIE4_9FUNG|nr:hypothetical protein H4R18_003437 [Coemansia javaensis]
MARVVARIAAAIWATGWIAAVLAHSWVDCVKYDPDSQLCLGYPRGYRGRKQVDPNQRYTYRFNAQPLSQAMCEPQNQGSAATYSDRFPMAVVQPGEVVYTAWEQNGHLNDTSPTKLNILYYDDAGREFVSAAEHATAPRAAAGLDFATSANCYDNKNPNSLCLGRWTVPSGLAPGRTYHFVWFWYFDKNPAGEWYSTCFDLAVAPASCPVTTKPLSAIVPGSDPSPEFSEGVTDAVRAKLSITTSLQPPTRHPPPPTTRPPPTSRPPPVPAKPAPTPSPPPAVNVRPPAKTTPPNTAGPAKPARTGRRRCNCRRHRRRRGTVPT